MNIKVLNDHVLLAPVDPKVTTGGIIIPDAHMDDVANQDRFIRDSNQFAKARVVAVHEGKRFATHEALEYDDELASSFCPRCLCYAKDEDEACRLPCDVEVGQHVIYRRAEAAKFELQHPETGEELVIVHEESCLGVVDPDCVVERLTGRDKE